jgi:hypothetical protein
MGWGGGWEVNGKVSQIRSVSCALFKKLAAGEGSENFEDCVWKICVYRHRVSATFLSSHPSRRSQKKRKSRGRGLALEFQGRGGKLTPNAVIEG